MGRLMRLAGARGFLALAVLAAAMLLGSPRLRAQATQLLACGVSLQTGDGTGSLGTRAASAIAGSQVERVSPTSCLRAVVRTTTAATAWLEHQRRPTARVEPNAPGGAKPRDRNAKP